MVSIKDLRKMAVSELGMVGCDSPKADVDTILIKLLGLTRTQIVRGEKELCDNEAELFKKSVERLKKGEPVQYIVGECEFMSLPFVVNSSTLVPRADTETLVEEIIGLYDNDRKISVMDIGTGTGCIAVSLAYYLKKAKVWAIDISQSAIDVAIENANAAGVSQRVEFIRHDIMKGFPQLDTEFDVVVSNPPYIPKEDYLHLDKKVKDFEPASALDGGEDGLDFYRQIVKVVKLKEGGVLGLEVGINQAEQVSQIMTERFSEIRTVKDLSGIDRVVLGKIKRGC